MTSETMLENNETFEFNNRKFCELSFVAQTMETKEDYLRRILNEAGVFHLGQKYDMEEVDRYLRYRQQILSQKSHLPKAIKHKRINEEWRNSTSKKIA